MDRLFKNCVTHLFQKLFFLKNVLGTMGNTNNHRKNTGTLPLAHVNQ